jgi:hypothetical protein
MLEKYTVNSESSLSEIIGKLRVTFKEKKYFQVTLNDGKKRSVDQNFVMHGWFKKISTEEVEYTPMQVKCLCKYHLFLPILRADDEYINQACIKVIDPLSYENRIKAMEFFPVTSLMKTKQIKLGMEHMQDHYAGRVTLEYEDK